MAKPKRLKSKKVHRQPSNKKKFQGNVTQTPWVFEAEVLKGLSTFVVKELRQLSGVKILLINETTIQFNFTGDLNVLKKLKRVVAVYLLTEYEIPRPKALLGDQHLRRLSNSIRFVLAQNIFMSFRFEAAGKNSSVFQRLAKELHKELKLPFNEEGDLMLRIKPSGKGWVVLVRLTPRPLSARAWRVCNMSGGLNASLAVCMNDLADLRPQERYLNAMCGSGTLLIEQAFKAKEADLSGIDIRQEAIECAKANVDSAKQNVKLYPGDATNLDFPDHHFDVITADLPWGDAIGDHEGNAELYPKFLEEMARVATENARLIVLTHEVKLFEYILENQSSWKLKKSFQVAHGGHNPKIYSLTVSAKGKR